MYRRDFAILLLSACALFLALRKEGSFEFRKAWYHTFEEAEDLFTLPPYSSPTPLAADLNGDGKPEILVASPEGKLLLLAPARPGDGFAPAKVLASIELDEERKMPLLALAAGYLTPPPAELVRAPRKQVVVVVTAGMEVLCLDHNLRKLWRQPLHAHFPEHSHYGEVVARVLDRRVRQGDKGLVVVGAGVSEAVPASRRLQREFELGREEIVGEGLERLDLARKLVQGGDTEEGQSHADPHNLEPARRQFAYFGFEGAQGAARWKHEAEDFRRDLGQLEDELVEQHSFHVSAQQSASREYGEESCRAFRSSILESLPHSWHGRWDTELRPMHFRRQQEARGSRKSELAGLPRERERDRRPPPGLDLHQDPRASPNPVAGAVGALLQRKDQRETTEPNVVVAHLRDGIEVVHIFSGRVLCRLHMPTPGLHTDLDADGVPDYVLAHGGDPLEAETMRGSGQYCTVVARSGLPPRRPLFNGSACAGLERHDLAGRLFPGMLELAPPAALPRLDEGTSGSRPRQRTVLLTSRGQLTGMDDDGEVAWQSTVDATWAPGGGDVHEDDGEVPTLKPLALHTHAPPTAVLAAGASQALVLDVEGAVLDELALPAVPAQPLVVVDWDMDGLNDIVLLSQRGIYGWAQVRHPGGASLSILVAALIVVMVGVYISWVREGGDGSGPAFARKGGRSTEQVR